MSSSFVPPLSVRNCGRADGTVNGVAPTVPAPVRRTARRARSGSSRALVGAVGVRRRLDPAAGAVALTFDDGPDPEHTPAILDELARLGVVATFFVVGRRARAHPGIVRRMVLEGHHVGSHSDSHPEPWRVPLATLARDYRRGRLEAERAAEREITLFRPPKGHVDGRGAAAMLAAKVRPWLWTIDPQDWSPGAVSDDIVAGVAHLAEGDVVLLHDAIEGPLAPSALDRSATHDALGGIVALARQRGLRFTTL
jgi:peptidoglycan-N-acetylglucosamine deacetylase